MADEGKAQKLRINMGGRVSNIIDGHCLDISANEDEGTAVRNLDCSDAHFSNT